MVGKPVDQEGGVWTGENREDHLSPRCPRDPVPGIVKLIIREAKMTAPSTPIGGIFRFLTVYRLPTLPRLGRIVLHGNRG